MTHTEKFNEIMKQSAKPRKAKAQPPKIELIGARENMNAMQTDLSKCEISGNVVTLPFERLPNYDQVRKALLNAGAKYNKNKFVFPNDARPYIDRLMGGENVNIKKEFQFFATPAPLAKYLVSLADIERHHSILEPSAGQGAIINAIIEKIPTKLVQAYELSEINRNVLQSIEQCEILGDDFLKQNNYRQFDRVIANPPFSKNQDIDHILKMYYATKLGGRIVTIASKHWQISNNKKETEFRNWLDEINADVQDIPQGAFKESGTNVASCIIIINK